MKNNPYQDFRQEMIDFLELDIIGPKSGIEVIEEAPTSRYSAGILFPQLVDNDEEVNERKEKLDMRSRDEEEGTIEYATSFFPSAMGISFSIDDTVRQLIIQVDTARYDSLESSDLGLVSCRATSISDAYMQNAAFTEKFDYKDGQLSLKSSFSKTERDYFISVHPDNKQFAKILYKMFRLQNGWKRIPISEKVELNLTGSRTEYKIEGEQLQIVVISKPSRNGKKLCTVSLINTSKTSQSQNDHKLAYFQTSIKLTSKSGVEVFEDLSTTEYISSDPEEASLKLLFRNKRYFATGHGCSADWESGGKLASAVYSVTIPRHIIPQMSFDIKSRDGSNVPNLKMATLAYSKQDEIIKELKLLVATYENWIDDLSAQSKTLDKSLNSVSLEHIESCRESASRMNSGINFLGKNPKAMRAFNLANEAMLMQRVHTNLQSKKKFPDEGHAMPDSYDDSDAKKPATWRPFQIAFLLMEVESLVNNESNFKDIVDLIWFPTGGGKTEAYLGLTAFTIFYRRLTHSDDESGGTTVIMRYTLRLLTSQQFQRACTLICACEKLRSNSSDLGDTAITIGLWLGQSTPYSIKDAEFRLADLMRQVDGSYNNPFQVLSCPWCGTHMVKKQSKGVNAYRAITRPRHRFVMYCPNRGCDFFDELPISIVDEDVYHQAPTLLFGTVDKFAMLPWKPEASKIFALDEGNKNLSPELIIQDELHLISGSLGTVVGLYESAIDLMCSAKGSKPKIIASTATIRRAKQQCNALYARDFRQFPSPGLDASDSFFAREADVTSDSPGRLYIGVMPSGTTSTWMQIKLMAGMSQGAEFIVADDEVKDKFWTQVVYCNSIRELGTSMSLAYDDVKAYSDSVAKRLGKKARVYSDKDVQELTSRISPESIPKILQRLSVEYPSQEVIDTLLATNMISVGVDIDRLGLMLVLGQPKTTSEYIQATSRVGRAYPGLVITLYGPTKSRDRSHYEQFAKYHQSLYRYVEPTSVTPFSAPVREKALHAVIITLVRHYMGIQSGKELSSFKPSDKKFQEIVASILSRVKQVDDTEVDKTKEEIDKIAETISELGLLGDGAVFGSSNPLGNHGKAALMRTPADKKGVGRYSTLQSMRSTDVEASIRLDHGHE
ncbi:MAG TPA: helicase-related protein [Verrucomicrobiae bacterium]|nr:helicase-related protein [Verrucomicrobiae bacterium]